MDKIKECALRLLARREHSLYELRQKLLLRKFPLEQIKQVIEELAQQGWQNDSRFAQTYYNNLIQRGYGPLKILAVMRSKGVSDDLIRQVISDDRSFWQEQIRTVYRKKYSPSTLKDKQMTLSATQIRFMLSRGFSKGQIMELMYEKQ
jgi:regulatory protein